MDKILSAMVYLNELIEDIGNYPDKSLFFQNPNVFEGWLALVGAIKEIESGDVSGEKTKWEQRTETCVEYLLSLRYLYVNYEKLYRTYHNQLKKLLDGYGGWLFGACFSGEGMEAMSDDQYWKELENVEDTTKYLADLNIKSLKARSDVYTVLSEIFQVLLAIMNRGGKIVILLNPYTEHFAKAIDDDLKGWTRNFGKEMFKKMKEDLNRYYKEHRTDPYTRELWGEMLSGDEDALNMAKRQQLTKCEDSKQEHWGEVMKTRMDENGQLMQQILSSCRSDELLDLGKAENAEPFISLLKPDNLSMFYEIIVRRSLIQCEMFPELKAEHDKWLNKTKEQLEVVEDAVLNAACQSKLEETASNGIEYDEEAVIAKLKPIFYNNEENVRRFLTEISGMPTEDITDLVNRWVGDKLISDYGNSRKGVLWGILHDAKLYSKSRSNWNGRVK